MENEVELVLRGPLVIRQIAGVRDRLLAALAENPRLAVVLEEEAEVDLSFVQLLLAGGLSARSAGGGLRLKHPPGEVLARIIAQGGFVRVDGPWSSGAAG